MDVDKCKTGSEGDLFVGPFEIQPGDTAFFYVGEGAPRDRSFTAFMNRGAARIYFFEDESSVEPFDEIMVTEGTCRDIPIETDGGLLERIDVECLEKENNCLLNLSVYYDLIDYSML